MNKLSFLITGGAGFIGSNFLEYMVPKYPEHQFINLDELTYAGNLQNLINIETRDNYSFIKGNICNSELIQHLFTKYEISHVVNFAAESHVDRSILDPQIFLKTNILGTQVLLDAALSYWKNKSEKERSKCRFLQISTDEVYGSLGDTGYFTEDTTLAPNSPYSASKASADLLVRSYQHTFNLPTLITRCSNNYGPYQFPEKLIPLLISNALEDKAIPVYGDGKNVRDWIFVLDHCKALETVLLKAAPGSTYNIGGHNEWQNIEIVRLILNKLNKPESLITFVKDRPGHDRRYAIDASKIAKDLGWEPEYSFEKGIDNTIDWYLSNDEWLEVIRSQSYLEYYNTMYTNR